jgi:hypothetical protein
LVQDSRLKLWWNSWNTGSRIWISVKDVFAWQDKMESVGESLNFIKN